MEQRPSIRVYASGRQFVVVPLATGADGEPTVLRRTPGCRRTVEVTPVHHVYLTMGRPVAHSLTQAISAAQAQSQAATGTRIAVWDGEGGRWWTHHLFRATIAWQADRIEIALGPEVPDLGGRVKADAEAPAEDPLQRSVVLPAGAPASEIAEWLIRALGERLS
jgi:hypothetical protein